MRRHTFGSLRINVGEPVTYVNRQLGHKDSAITLKVYARWLQDDLRRRGVDRLDETQPSATCPPPIITGVFNSWRRSTNAVGEPVT